MRVIPNYGILICTFLSRNRYNASFFHAIQLLIYSKTHKLHRTISCLVWYEIKIIGREYEKWEDGSMHESQLSHFLCAYSSATLLRWRCVLTNNFSWRPYTIAINENGIPVRQTTPKKKYTAIPTRDVLYKAHRKEMVICNWRLNLLYINQLLDTVIMKTMSYGWVCVLLWK